MRIAMYINTCVAGEIDKVARTQKWKLRCQVQIRLALKLTLSLNGNKSGLVVRFRVSSAVIEGGRAGVRFG